MADIKTGHMTALDNAIRKTLTAHEAISAEIATHAEKHRADLDARRREAEQQRKISEGIERVNAKLRADRVCRPAEQVRLLDS